MKGFRFASIVAAVLLWSGSSAWAVTYVWDMDCTEDQVSNSGIGDGSTDSTATGHANLRYDTLTGRMSYEISWSDLLGDLSAIHIHGPAAPLAINMQHVFNIFTGEPDVIAAGVNRTTDTVEATDTLFNFISNSNGAHLPEAALQDMVDEMAYVNIHSTMWPNGEIRCHFVLAQTLTDTEQTKAQQKCTGVTLKGLPKVSGTRSKQVVGCISAKTKDRLAGTAEDCVIDDPKQKIATALAKVDAGFTDLCTGVDGDGIATLPPYGVTTSGRIADASGAPGFLAHLMFGADLDVAVADAADPLTGKCQVGTMTAASRCLLARLKEFGKCVKGDLAGKEGLTIVDLTGFEACIGRDSKGRVAKACDAVTGKVRQALDKRCVGVDLSSAVAGCGTADPTGSAVCIEGISRCMTCGLLAFVHDMTVDCDLQDDGAANGSCIIPGP